MEFNNKFNYDWGSEGAEPSSSLKETGFQSGYKPSASVFNNFWYKVIKCITELQTKLKGLETDTNSTLSAKVDKVSGKGLSENDYTTTEKNKLAGIAAEANKTVVDTALSSSSTNPVQNKVINTALAGKSSTSHTHSNATASASGFMSASDKTKLDGIAEGANNYVLPHATFGIVGGVKLSSPFSITSSGTLNISSASTTQKGAMSSTDKTKLDGIETGANKTVIDESATEGSNNAARSGDVYEQMQTMSNNLGSVSAFAVNHAGETIPSDSGSHGLKYDTTAKKFQYLNSSSNWTDIALGVGTKGTTVAPNGITYYGGAHFDAGENAVIFGDTRTVTQSGETVTQGNFGAEYSLIVGTKNVSIFGSNYIFGDNNTTSPASYCLMTGNGNSVGSGGMSGTLHGSGNYGTYNNFFAAGKGNSVSDCQAAVGRYCGDSVGATSDEDTTGDVFKVGVGTSSSNRSNAFRVSYAGKCYGLSSFMASGADYAEMWEIEGGNSNGDNYCGYFLTVNGNNKVQKANANDFILGVGSAKPCVLGDVQSEYWKDKYLKDVFGNDIFETEEIPETTNENGVTIPAHTVRKRVLNPEYDATKPYVSRENRKEWQAVGLMGKLVVIDDGTCTAGSFCTVADGGTATASTSGYRVLERIDDTHIRILFR